MDRAGDESHAKLQSASRRGFVPPQRRVPYRAAQQPAGFRRRQSRCDRGRAVRSRQARLRCADPAQSLRRYRRLHPPPRRPRHDAQGIPRGLCQPGRGRLDRHVGAGRIRRTGLALDAHGRDQRIPGVGQSCLLDVSRADTGRDRRDPDPWLRCAEENLPAENDRGPLGRHDESHRAALRHGSRTSAHQGSEASRRLLQDHRHQDFHFRRRAGSHREHRASRAGADRRRAGKAPRASRSSSCRK